MSTEVYASDDELISVSTYAGPDRDGSHRWVQVTNVRDYEEAHRMGLDVGYSVLFMPAADWRELVLAEARRLA